MRHKKEKQQYIRNLIKICMFVQANRLVHDNNDALQCTLIQC